LPDILFIRWKHDTNLKDFTKSVPIIFGVFENTHRFGKSLIWIWVNYVVVTNCIISQFHKIVFSLV